MGLIGTTIAGKYRIDSFLNRGGMGAVYRATHLMLEREVVIKIIHPELVVSKETISRFLREARAASQLTHPNIVTIHDLGQIEHGSLYIAMELVDGISLAELLKKEGTLEPSRATKLIEGICSGLSVAHEKGVVHRDLKPANIMVVTDREGNETTKILDFGIAKTLDTHATALTATGMALGSPHYMSPEQVNGQEVDARADIYALGIILFQMLTGKVAFAADSAFAVVIKQMNEIPQPPSALVPGLPPALDMIVLRCLEKDREKRFSSARKLAKALRSSLEVRSTLQPKSTQVLAPPAAQSDVDAARDETHGPPDSSGNTAAGLRWKVLGGGAAAIAAVVALVWLGTRGGETADAPEPVADPGVLAESNRGAEAGETPEAIAAGSTVESASEPLAMLRVDSEEPGTTVWVDGQAEGEAPILIELSAGSHRVQVRKSECESASKQVELTLGQRVRMSLAPDCEARRQAAAEAERLAEEHRQEGERERLAELRRELEQGAAQERQIQARGDLGAAIRAGDENGVRRSASSLRDLLGTAAASDADLRSAASWLSDLEAWQRRAAEEERERQAELDRGRAAQRAAQDRERSLLQASVREAISKKEWDAASQGAQQLEALTGPSAEISNWRTRIAAGRAEEAEESALSRAQVAIRIREGVGGFALDKSKWVQGETISANVSIGDASCHLSMPAKGKKDGRSEPCFVSVDAGSHEVDVQVVYPACRTFMTPARSGSTTVKRTLPFRRGGDHNLEVFVRPGWACRPLVEILVQ